jgi:septal ring factor EnvC (AmiA/AmiB activator)
MALELKETGRALEEMKKEKEREREKKDRPPLIEVKGYLLPPVEGEVIHFFGLEEDPITGRKVFHQGITIAAPPGTPVRAPFGGIIRKISSVQGQGLVVFIDHGYHFLSVIGGLGKVKAVLGSEVETGEVIGEVGELPYTVEGIYYELLYHDRPQNPLDWLDTSKLKFLR